MIVYDKTEFHGGINLKGTDVEQSKFPRVDRDGLFVDEVRSNPTTGLLEIWDGTQWLGYIMEPMPNGSIHQTMRYGQNGWESTPEVLVNNLSDTTLLVNHKTQTASRYIEANVGNTISILRVSSDATNKYAILSSGGTTVQMQLQRTSSNYVIAMANETESYFKIVASSTNSQLNLNNTPTYTPASTIISYGNRFAVYQNGKIKTEYLSGTNSALVEALPDGTMQRSTSVIPKVKIVERTLTAPTAFNEFIPADLGITGNLTEKIFSCDMRVKPSGATSFSNIAKSDINEAMLSDSSFLFVSNTLLPIGTVLRLAITYID